MSKTIVCIIGAGASGKSTLTRALCQGRKEEHKLALWCREKRSGATVIETVTYTLTENEIAVAGNLKNGADSVHHMHALQQLVDVCWRKRDIVIVDTVRPTNKFVDWVRDHPFAPAALFVFLRPSLDENLSRLRGRRHGRGVVERELPPRTFWNVFRFRSRAMSVWNYARVNFRREHARFVEITGQTPEQAAHIVLSTLQELERMEYGFSRESRAT